MNDREGAPTVWAYERVGGFGSTSTLTYWPPNGRSGVVPGDFDPWDQTTRPDFEEVGDPAVAQWYAAGDILALKPSASHSGGITPCL
jgi:hypothetical protein